jgi:hypothetical protein
MSGSSSSGRSFSGGGSSFSGETTQGCFNLKGSTKVISPTMPYFSTISVGEVLNVILDEESVVLVNKLDDHVGGVNPTWVIELIECLKIGNKYIATVTKINGAAIDVYIKII